MSRRAGRKAKTPKRKRKSPKPRRKGSVRILEPAIIEKPPRRTVRPSSLVDTRIIYCGDCLDQLRKLPERRVDLNYNDYMHPRSAERAHDLKIAGSFYYHFDCHAWQDALLFKAQATRTVR